MRIFVPEFKPSDSAPPKDGQLASHRRYGRLCFWLPLTLLVLILSFFWWFSTRINGGHFAYTLDDAYIHMATAKNLSQSRVWGATPFEFTSASSSPLWTVLLGALYLCLGVNVGTPLVLNSLCAVLVLLAAWHVLRSNGLNEKSTLVVQVALILLTPLPYLVFDGMENTLQTVVFILALFQVADIVERPDDERRNHRRVVLLGWVFLLCAVRYEGIFFAMAAGTLFLLRKSVKDAVLTGFAAGAPLVISGTWFVRHGWPFLPMPIVLKTSLNSTSLSGLIVALRYNLLGNYRSGIYIVMLAALSLFLSIVGLSRGREPWHRLNVASLLFVFTALAHLACARIGGGYRYEAYLVAAGIIVIAAQCVDTIPDFFSVRQDRHQLMARVFPTGVLLAVALLPLFYRGADSLRKLAVASHNIYEQQCQMACFIRKYYQGQSVALNDIGAVNFYSRIHCLDLWGLANLSAAKARMASRLTSGEINRLALDANTRIAILTVGWFDDKDEGMSGLPDQWVPVGTWTIRNNVACGADTVTFFAADPNEVPRLLRHLKEFSSQLPADVAQAGLYTQALP